MLKWKLLVEQICSLALPSSGRPSGPLALCIDFIAGWSGGGGGREVGGGGGGKGGAGVRDCQHRLVGVGEERRRLVTPE